jgi:tetratricopeptide (TPR) repeat protein
LGVLNLTFKEVRKMRKVNLTDIILGILVVILIVLLALFAKEYNHYKKVVAPCWAYVDKGQYSEAIEYYYQVQDHHPSLLSCVATAYYYQNNYPNALVFFKEAEKEGDLGANTLFLIANTYEQIGDDENAVRYYKKSLRKMIENRKVREEFKEKYIETLQRIASIYEKKGKLDEAEEYRSCAVRLCKDI